MLDAIAISVAANGYSATSVADVIEGAGVSRRTFYEHFRDKEECYLAAYEESVNEALDAVRDGVSAAEDWIERVRGGLRAYLGYLAAHPDASRAFIVEVLAAGPRALAQRDRVHATFAAFLRAARLEAAWSLQLPALPDETFELMVGGIEHVVAQEIRTGGASRLLELEPSLLYIQLTLFAGHRHAAAASDHGSSR